jgi:hypothetical protein
LQPKIKNQVATNRSFFACNQHQSRYFFLAKNWNNMYFWFYFFFCNPHTTMIFFSVHTNFLWQSDSIIRCKQVQQNNCRLAHTADYYSFFAMHMRIMLQPEGTLHCKLAR